MPEVAVTLGDLSSRSRIIDLVAPLLIKSRVGSMTSQSPTCWEMDVCAEK